MPAGMKTVLAVDLGGTKTALARVDEEGGVREVRTLPAARTLDASVGQVAAACAGVDAVGMIVPGMVDHAAGTAWCPNLWGTDHVPLLAALRERVPLEIFADSDRAGYVLGESWLGAARGLRHVVFVAVGTGIGVGILSDGVVVRGAGGIAGAAGWFALDSEWRDHYAATGCWEAESAGPAVARLAGLPDAHAVVAQARAGDAHALEVLRRAGRFIGMGVANLISALNPEAVVLGGGLMIGASGLLLDLVRSEARRWAQPIAAAQCRIELTELGEKAGLLGAARLAIEGLSRGPGGPRPGRPSTLPKAW
jgi:glucokinase